MTSGKKIFYAATAFVCLVLITSCTSYERQVVPFKMPESLPNAVTIDGAIIAARSFANADEAKNVFGFDIRSAGILPVQVIFDNKSNQRIMIVSAQTFLVDEESNVWPILDQSLAYDRLTKTNELGKVVPEAVKGGILFSAVGAVIGAQGSDMQNNDMKFKIKEDLQSRSLQHRAVNPGELAYGFIFYPGEIKSAKVLRLQLKMSDTGKIYTYDMKL
jgi:hypothetical protein